MSVVLNLIVRHYYLSNMNGFLMVPLDTKQQPYAYVLWFDY